MKKKISMKKNVDFSPWVNRATTTHTLILYCTIFSTFRRRTLCHMNKGAASWAGSAACFTDTWICRAHYWSNWVDTIWSGSLSKNFTGVCQPFFQPSSPKKWAGQNQQMCLLGTSFGRFLSFSKLEFVNVRPCKRYAHWFQSPWKCARIN